MIRVDEEFLPTKNGFAKKYYLKEVLELLNNPQAKLPTINIVGTNGKGSTSFYLSQALKQKYQKVGLFISPAFLYQNERIQINNELISDEKIFAYYEQIKTYLDKFPLTFFEIWTLMAILYFVEEKVDIVVMEAGIGGMLDATNNMTNQIATLLTVVGYDHTEILGETIDSILENKIKIAKPGTKLFISSDNQKWQQQINKILEQLKDVEITWTPKLVDAIKYQEGNKGLVKTFVETIGITNHDYLQLEPPLGRFTELSTAPLVLIDGAHNENGLENFVQSFQKKYPTKKPKVLVGFSMTKDFQENLKTLNETFGAEVYLTEFEHFKSWTIPQTLTPKKVRDWKKFLQENLQANNDVIICGSLYFIPLVYEWFLESRNG